MAELSEQLSPMQDFQLSGMLQNSHSLLAAKVPPYSKRKFTAIVDTVRRLFLACCVVSMMQTFD